MTPQEAFLDYFRRMSQIAPKRIIAFSGLHTGQPNGMAAGLESLLAFARLVEDPNAVILDLGAGASSFVLRSLFKNVVSSDSDAEYLSIVQRACGEAGLSTDNFLVGLDDIPEGDYTFYDYGGDIDRTNNMAHVWGKTRRLLWIDDCDLRPVCADFMRRVRAFFDVLGLLVEYQPDGLDSYSRSGSVIRKKS